MVSKMSGVHNNKDGQPTKKTGVFKKAMKAHAVEVSRKRS